MQNDQQQGDLFHEIQTAKLGRQLTSAEYHKIHRETRSKKHGHAAPPGTGPEGETCGSCAHLVRIGQGRRAYFKCELMRHIWTGGYGTDIRCMDLACQRWESTLHGVKTLSSGSSHEGQQETD